MRQLCLQSLFYFLLIQISSINLFSQNHNAILWVFSNKAYIISNTSEIHDTLGHLSWLDSVSYNPYQQIILQSFDNQNWRQISYKNKLAWIKENEITTMKELIQGKHYDAYLQIPFSPTYIFRSHIAILDKNKNLITVLGDLSLDHGLWITPSKFLFQSNETIYLYSTINNQIQKIAFANDFLWNNELNKVIYINPYSFIDYDKDSTALSVNSINIDGTQRRELFNLQSRSIILGVADDDFTTICLILDGYNGTKCYSFLVTINDRVAKIFIDWSGKHINTIFQ